MQPQRIIIRASVQQIPGEPLERPFTLCDRFCRSVIGRPLKLHGNGFDAVHIPPSFDSDKDVRIWFMLDLGVCGTLSREEVREVPLTAYIARLETGDGDL